MAEQREDPFKPEDLQRILHEEQGNSEKEGWNFVKRAENAEVWRKNDEKSPINLIKAFLQFPGIPPADVLELIANIDLRRRWEQHFSAIEVIEELPNYMIVYWHFKMPPGVSDRDLVQYVTHRKDEEKNLSYVLYKDATDDRRPEVSGLVRAKTILSGTLIRSFDDDPNSTKVTMLLQNDAMGLIPKFIMNNLSAKTPFEWQEHLTRFYHDVYVKEKAQ